MSEPRRATDRLSYRAVITFISVCLPIAVNIYTLGQYTGATNAKISALEKQVDGLQAIVLAHLAGTNAMLRGLPQSDKGTTPQTPPPAPAPKPQGFRAGDCHLDPLKPAPKLEAKK